jgi:hypothetical protein
VGMAPKALIMHKAMIMPMKTWAWHPRYCSYNS